MRLVTWKYLTSTRNSRIIEVAESRCCEGQPRSITYNVTISPAKRPEGGRETETS